MDKLIELLNEYEDLSDAEECEKWKIDEYDRISEWGWRSQWTNGWICSKEFWFIEWLYNHKKMTLERLKVSDLYWDINDWVWPVDNIIMHLSISENPIELLISMLK